MLPPNRIFATYTDDTAALETDTMRFLAILSICLMAIFALIESIPETAGKESVAIEIPADLVRRAEELKAHIEALRGEANELVGIIEGLSKHTEQKRDRLIALTERMQVTEQWLEVQDEKLERVMTRVTSGREELRTLARRIRSVETTAQASEARIKEAREEIGESPSPEPVDPSPPTETLAETLAETRPAPPRPLSLRFDTTDAMESLVRQGRVQLFAKISGSVWRATTTLAFDYDELPGGNVYLVVDSVGKRLKDAFRRTVVSTRKPEWYVVFDAEITVGIADIVRQHRHGDIVVARDGAVFHVPFPQ